jgi:mono/diheme cytochrome c family protein
VRTRHPLGLAGFASAGRSAGRAVPERAGSRVDDDLLARARVHPARSAALGLALSIALISLAVPVAAENRTTRGALLYSAHCARCHGPDGRGDGPDAQFFARPPRDLRTGVLERYPSEELVARIREGRPLRIEIDREAMAARSRDTEAIVAYLGRLPEIDWEAVERGNEVFLDRCEICHGPFGRPAPTADLPPGVQRLPRDLSSPEVQQALSDADLLSAVRHGRAGMPAIPALQSESDARVLVAFVRTLSPGRELYGVYCTGCHGEDGRGDVFVVDERDRPKIVFDRAYLSSRDPEDLRRNVWHMLAREAPSMPHLSRRLSDDQAQAIIAFLRGRGPAPSPSAAPAPPD